MDDRKEILDQLKKQLLETPMTVKEAAEWLNDSGVDMTYCGAWKFMKRNEITPQPKAKSQKPKAKRPELSHPPTSVDLLSMPSREDALCQLRELLSVKKMTATEAQLWLAARGVEMKYGSVWSWMKRGEITEKSPSRRRIKGVSFEDVYNIIASTPTPIAVREVYDLFWSKGIDITFRGVSSWMKQNGFTINHDASEGDLRIVKKSKIKHKRKSISKKSMDRIKLVRGFFIDNETTVNQVYEFLLSTGKKITYNGVRLWLKDNGFSPRSEQMKLDKSILDELADKLTESEMTTSEIMIFMKERGHDISSNSIHKWMYKNGFSRYSRSAAIYTKLKKQLAITPMTIREALDWLKDNDVDQSYQNIYRWFKKNGISPKNAKPGSE